MFALLVIVSCVSVKLITDVREYATLINYVGKVRGATQRAVKLETNGIRDDGLMQYMDDILAELMSGQGQYGLVRADSEAYQNHLKALSDQWGEVKTEITLVREGVKDTRIIPSSEQLFDIADKTVSSIEDYSRQKSMKAGSLLLLSALLCAAAFALLIYEYVRKYFDLKKAKESLEKMAGRDELTGAFTMEKFRTEADRLLREEKGREFALLFINFENFKYVNEVFGYEFGDRLLKEYSRLMTESLRENEIFGRNMADRFVALRCFSDRTTMLERQKQVDREFLSSELVLSNKHLLTIACGICCAQDLVEEPCASLMTDRADFAQKSVKDDPRSHYAFYNEEMRQKLFTEISIRDRMRDALQNGEFVVYMQPKVNVEDERIKGAEALVRWVIPEKGTMSPAVFIPVLEKNHFISQVDRYIFEQVCGWLRRRLDAGQPVVPVSVNVSRVQFYTPDFVERYVSVKQKYRIPDRLLEIEFTETVAFGNLEYMMEIVADLHKNGFLCSLDDFGSGYSSLGMLKDLQFDVLKLDGTFFRTSVNVRKESIILKSIIHMVKDLEIRTVAEGVEREEQKDFLRSVGCDLIQGYIFYKPMPLEVFENVLEQS